MGYFGSKTPIEWRDEHRTPKYIFAYADRRWGPIKVDLAASSENPLCRYWITKDQDSLTACWHKIDQAGPAMKDAPIESGWCNPPYSQITPWIQKAIGEARSDFTTIMLLPELCRYHDDRRPDRFRSTGRRKELIEYTRVHAGTVCSTADIRQG